MTGIKPPAGFENSVLDIETIPAGRRFGRIYASAFPDPLGYGKTPSRFSDPRRRDPARRFGVVYLGDTLKVCFLEAVLRDRRDGLVGDIPIYRLKSAGRPLTAVDPSRSYLDLDVSICFGQKLSSIECAAASRYALEDSAQWPVN
ncbi:RES domain-containing protein [Ensifer sp. 22460]|uniref:RES domain-containing protein n=2 Tax=unclassified Ensifer TaxID=2633371 RepID=UPI003F86BA3E